MLESSFYFRISGICDPDFSKGKGTGEFDKDLLFLPDDLVYSKFGVSKVGSSPFPGDIVASSVCKLSRSPSTFSDFSFLDPWLTINSYISTFIFSIIKLVLSKRSSVELYLAIDAVFSFFLGFGGNGDSGCLLNIFFKLSISLWILE